MDLVYDNGAKYVENKQTRPTYDATSRNGTLDTMMEGRALTTVATFILKTGNKKKPDCFNV